MKITDENIRPMTEKDLDAVAEIEKQSFSLPWSRQSLCDSLLREDTIFLVCEEEGEVIGYVGMYVLYGEGEITNVAVLPEQRGRGCGKKLMEQILAKAAQREAASVLLEVRASNRPAIALYRSLGFEEIGVRKNFYEHPTEDAIIMKVGI